MKLQVYKYPITVITMPAITAPRALILSFPGMFMTLANAGTNRAAIPRIITRIPRPTTRPYMSSPVAFSFWLLYI